jgi:hypothetical protein
LESRRTTLALILIILLCVLVLGGLTYVNYRFAVENPGGNDFLSRWMGTRMLLTRGWSPYSNETTREIHIMVYGRAAKPDEDQVLFVYPLYSIILMFPYALIADYPLARALWMTTLEVSLVIITLLGISLSRWQIPRWMMVLLAIFSVSWYHGLRPIINGNPSILVALSITLAFFAIYKQMDALAGFLLALTTIKPQMIVLVLLLVMIWCISHRRWTILWSFLGSLVILVVATSLIIPDWVIQNLRQILSYPDYTLAGTPGAIFRMWLPGVGRQLGWGLTIFLSLVMIWEWRAAIGKEYRWFLWTAYLTLVITNLIGIRTATANFVVMFPALIMIFAFWEKRWGRIGRLMVISSVVVLFIGLWWLFLRTLIQGDQPIQHSIMFFPYPLFVLLGLYWIRWWAVRPRRMFIDQLREVVE